MLNNNIRRCSHTKTNGIQCGSPALRNSDYCYFHRQARRDFPKRATVQTNPEPIIDLALIDDPDGIHYALMQVMRGLLNGTLTPKSAGLILQALQIMSSNFKHTSFQRQLEDEYRKSDLNAYELWEKYAKIRRQEEEARVHEKRVEELKRLQTTCCKCHKQIQESSPEKEEPPQHSPADEDTQVTEHPTEALTIKACAAIQSPDHQIARSPVLLIALSSKLERTICDLDSLLSSDARTRASQRC